MNFNQIFYQIYPLGMCGAPKENDGVTVSRIRRILDFIPHFRKLGITAVWFSPVFESDRHGYDTRDYRRIDCRLGTNEDFREVCDALHEAGIRVVLDGVFNHTGRGFGPFLDVLQHRQESPYAGWFFINFNDTWAEDGFTYADWEGHHELVKLNLQNPDVRKYLLDSIDLWIRDFGIDGLRLDVAYMVDRSFLSELRSHTKQINPDFMLLGEMIGGDYNVLLKDCGLDSVTNYECRKGIYSSFNSHNMFEIGFSLNRQFGPENWTLYRGQHLLSFTDNHDVDRIASVLEDERDLPLSYALLYAMPGMPCIYYGSEWGEKAKRTPYSDDALRPAFEKPQWNSLCDTIAALSRMRTAYPVFTDGDYRQIWIQNEQLVFSRTASDGTLLFAINISSNPVHAAFHTDLDHAVNLLTGETVSLRDGADLAPKSAYFWYQKTE